MWKDYRLSNGERIESHSLRKAGRQIGDGIERTLDFMDKYQGEIGVAVAGTAFVVSGIDNYFFPKNADMRAILDITCAGIFACGSGMILTQLNFGRRNITSV